MDWINWIAIGLSVLALTITVGSQMWLRRVKKNAKEAR